MAACLVAVLIVVALTNPVLGALPICAKASIGYDRPGNDIGMAPGIPTLDSCYKACMANPKCAFFNFRKEAGNPQKCYLKTGGGKPVKDPTSMTYWVAPCRPGNCLPTKDLWAAWPLTDFYGRTVMPYNRYKDHKFCTFGNGDDQIRIKIRVLVHYENNRCGNCLAPGQAHCQIWHPDPSGNYQPGCSMSVYQNEFEMITSFPGYEPAMGWGYEVFPHVHYACCCGTSCVVNKFYFKAHNFTGLDPRLQQSNPGNTAVKLGPKEYSYAIKIPDGGNRWWPYSDMRDISMNRAKYGFSTNVQTWQMRPL